MEKLFLFGEEFEAILDILEDDEELEDEFTATGKDLSSKYPNLRRTIDSVINFRPPGCALNYGKLVTNTTELSPQADIYLFKTTWRWGK